MNQAQTTPPVSEASKKVIVDHLNMRQANPQEQEDMGMMQSWLFQIAENIYTQLICIEPRDDDLTLIMMTPIAIKPHDEVPIMASALAAALSPVDIISLPDQLALRLIVRGNRNTIADLIDETIILFRHVAESVCVPAVQLASGDLNFQQAMEHALQALQKPSQSNQPTDQQA
ncbi:hypothetical protein M3P05_05420 [Sansalvadorimonas sp. 2012CJ34-2]|uniref:Uncharacterized protein n=1 Tax=Parendozoicomonas callyspongiae TaxID=2942213 RepID=A0ABT0PDF0_9GAMM|nr:hypothetical protein [Sansalvadorimonas sp. 2012CJ34-2]MCL6269385.1 hypothetical protein [Sansalvadorimonas sp. 2012CJ34-2]